MDHSPYKLVSITILVITPILIIYQTYSSPTSCDTSHHTWTEGNYKVKDRGTPSATVLVEGSRAVVRKRKWLESETEGVTESCWRQVGEDRILLDWEDQPALARISQDRLSIQLESPPEYEGTELVWIPDTEAKELNLKDPVSAPPNPYKKRSPGAFVFLSGPPGAGKSSIAAKLSVNAGYVYYEGDAFDSGVNPYTPGNSTEPSLATQKQHPLVGPGMHRRKDIVDKFSGLKFGAMLGDYSKLDPEVISDFLIAMAEDITKERARIGGDWIVAFAVPDIASRNFLKKLLGPDLVFVVLELTPELQAQRLEGRHEDDKETARMLESIFRLYEPASDGEMAAIGLTQSKDGTVEESAEEVLGLVHYYYANTNA